LDSIKNGERSDSELLQTLNSGGVIDR